MGVLVLVLIYPQIVLVCSMFSVFTCELNSSSIDVMLIILAGIYFYVFPEYVPLSYDARMCHLN